jgi:hypothetical protein
MYDKLLNDLKKGTVGMEAILMHEDTLSLLASHIAHVDSTPLVDARKEGMCNQFFGVRIYNDIGMDLNEYLIIPKSLTIKADIQQLEIP